MEFKLDISAIISSFSALASAVFALYVLIFDKFRTKYKVSILTSKKTFTDKDSKKIIYTVTIRNLGRFPIAIYEVGYQEIGDPKKNILNTFNKPSIYQEHPKKLKPRDMEIITFITSENEKFPDFVEGQYTFTFKDTEEQLYTEVPKNSGKPLNPIWKIFKS